MQIWLTLMMELYLQQISELLHPRLQRDDLPLPGRPHLRLDGRLLPSVDRLLVLAQNGDVLARGRVRPVMVHWSILVDFK